jgi:uncharacterized membrane protein
MKAIAVIGYILAVLSLLGGFIVSLNSEFTTSQGLAVFFSGIVTAILFALPSTAIIGIVQIRKLLEKRFEQ